MYTFGSCNDLTFFVLIGLLPKWLKNCFIYYVSLVKPNILVWPCLFIDVYASLWLCGIFDFEWNGLLILSFEFEGDFSLISSLCMNGQLSKTLLYNFSFSTPYLWFSVNCAISLVIVPCSRSFLCKICIHPANWLCITNM